MEKPAIEGGKPIRKKFLPYGTQWIDDNEINEVVDSLKSDWITTGPKMRTFEEKFKQFKNSKYAVAVNTCTDALFFALTAAELRPEMKLSLQAFLLLRQLHVFVGSERFQFFVI